MEDIIPVTRKITVRNGMNEDPYVFSRITIISIDYGRGFFLFSPIPEIACSHSLPLTLFNPECNPSSRIPINRRALVAETIQNIDELKIRAEELQKQIDDTWRYL